MPPTGGGAGVPGCCDCTTAGITVGCCAQAIPTTLTIGTPLGSIPLVYDNTASIPGRSVVGWYGCISSTVLISDNPCSTSTTGVSAVLYCLRCTGTTFDSWRLGCCSVNCPVSADYQDYPKAWDCFTEVDGIATEFRFLSNDQVIYTPTSSCSPVNFQFYLSNAKPVSIVWGTIGNGQSAILHIITV